MSHSQAVLTSAAGDQTDQVHMLLILQYGLVYTKYTVSVRKYFGLNNTYTILHRCIQVDRIQKQIAADNTLRLPFTWKLTNIYTHTHTFTKQIRHNSSHPTRTVVANVVDKQRDFRSEVSEVLLHAAVHHK